MVLPRRFSCTFTRDLFIRLPSYTLALLGRLYGNKQRPTTWEKQRQFIQSLLEPESQPPVTCILAEAQRQAEERESFVGAKREDSRSALIGDCWPGEAGHGPTRSGDPMCSVRGVYLAFSGWSQVGKKDEK